MDSMTTTPESDTARISRREFFMRAQVPLTAATFFPYLNALGTEAIACGVKHKSCILLFMDGGPSHIDTFDPKPEAPDEYRGPLNVIPTSVPGIHISELFPHFARQIHHAAIIRSMSTPENDHHRGRYHLHTGYRPLGGGLVHPSIGSIAFKELRTTELDIPGYIHLNDGNIRGCAPGYLGPRYQVLIARDGKVANANSSVSPNVFSARLELLTDLDERFHEEHAFSATEAHTTLREQTVRVMNSRHLAAFDISAESASLRKDYGNTRFGDACMRARRLVEAGVPFIEVNSTGRWDHHGNLYQQIPSVAGEVDRGMAELVRDLHDRGMLEHTLVIWMGEFGRTPKLNGGSDSGRDHYSKAWSIVLAGGGIKGGQVIGRTDRLASTVEERPVSVSDLMATICKIVGIDPKKEYNAPGSRPIPVVASQSEEPKPIVELFG
jgi:hypothetical protein